MCCLANIVYLFILQNALTWPHYSTPAITHARAHSAADVQILEFLIRAAARVRRIFPTNSLELAFFSLLASSTYGTLWHKSFRGEASRLHFSFVYECYNLSCFYSDDTELLQNYIFIVSLMKCFTSH